MQPRSLQQVLGELDSVYQPQVDTLRQRQDAIPGQIQAEEQGLEGKRQFAHQDILNAARRRGTGVAFGGIPIAEQTKYDSTDYMPALARLRQSGREQATSLEDAINGIYERRMNTGQQIYQNEQSMAEQRRQFDTNLAFQREQAAAQQRAQAAAYAQPTFNPSVAQQQPQYIGNNDLRGHLAYLAQKQGNKDAAVALKYVGNDGRYYLDPYTTNPTIFKALDALGAKNTWRP